METANHLRFHSLNEHLHDPARQHGPLLPERLATLGGRPLGALQRALPELRRGVRVSLTGGRVGVLPGYDPIPRSACRGCAAQRGATTTLTRWVPLHLNVCQRHRRWIGPTNQADTDQLDLTHLDQILMAARHHYNLVRHYGSDRVQHAYSTGLHITLRWAERNDFPSHRERRLRALRFDPNLKRLPSRHPALRAAIYPEAVILTSLLASTYWASLAAAEDYTLRHRFLAEATRRLAMPEYEPYAATEPLGYWAYHDAAQHLEELNRQAQGSDQLRHRRARSFRRPDPSQLNLSPQDQIA